MKLQSVGRMTGAIIVLFVMTPRAEAAILAYDDFSRPGSGIGWEAGNDWEGLGGGVVSTADVESFRNFASPIDATNQVTYIRFDFTRSVPGNGPLWGGAALFEGVEGAAATETFFVGDPYQLATYGLDLKSADVTVDSGIAIDNQAHTIIASIDTTPSGASAIYQVWVDNFNASTPTATTTFPNSPIDAPWGTLRFASDPSMIDLFDNLTIATTPREVGLVPEPGSLELLVLFGVAALFKTRPRH